MPRFRCPKCQTTLEATNAQIGKRVTCPDCDEKLIVPGAAVQRGAPPRDTSAVEREPARKSAGARRPAQAEAPRGDSTVLIWSCVGGGVGALLLLLVVVVLLSKKGKPDDIAVAPSPPVVAPRPTEVAPKLQPLTPAPSAPASSTPPQPKEEPLPAFTGAPASANDVYQYVLKSVAWIAVPVQGGVVFGTGTLVDRDNRLVLTNYHVVSSSKDVAVVFPLYHPDGKLITERETYVSRIMKKEDVIIKGKVVAEAQRRDMALIQLERVPEGFEAMKLAPANPQVGQSVYSVGNPGGSSALWLLTTGSVRQVSRKRWIAGGGGRAFELEAEVVETSSPTNPGDSGGPLVNDRGEQIGVTQGGSTVANLISLFISANEATSFMKQHYQTASLAWPPVSRAALAAGSTVSEAQVPDLIKALSHADPSVRGKAAQALGQLGPKGRLAVAALMRLLKDPEDYVRRFAEEALNQIGTPGREELPALQAALRDTSLEARRYAAAALGQMGAEARFAAPSLVAALKDVDATVRQTTARSLGKLGPDAKDTILPGLLAAVQDSDRGVRVAAAESLTRCGTLRSSDVAAFQGLLQHQDSEVRTQAARALGLIGPGAKSALPDLLKAWREPDAALRRETLASVGTIAPEVATLLPLLKEALSDADDGVRRAGAERLAKLGPEAKPLVQALTKVLKDGDKDVRKNAALALGKVGPPAKEAVPILAELLRDPEQEVLVEATAALQSIGPDAKAVPGLIGLFTNADAALRTKAAQTLAKVGKPALGPLAQALDDNNEKTRLGAASTLGEMGPAARESRNALSRLAVHAQADQVAAVREQCADALRRIQAKP